MTIVFADRLPQSCYFISTTILITGRGCDENLGSDVPRLVENSVRITSCEKGVLVSFSTGQE